MPYLNTYKLSNFILDGNLLPNAAELLSNAVTEGKSILISGPTNSGKTALLEALLPYLEVKKTLVVEDNRELYFTEIISPAQSRMLLSPIFTQTASEAKNGTPDQIITGLSGGGKGYRGQTGTAPKNVTRLATGRDCTYDQLIASASKMASTHPIVILGEIRNADDAELALKVLNSPESQLLATVHAATAEEANLRMASFLRVEAVEGGYFDYTVSLNRDHKVSYIIKNS